MAWVWTAVVVASLAAMVWTPIWAVMPALRGAWAWIVDPAATEELRKGGGSTLRRVVVAVVVFMVANLLFHYIFRQSLTRTDFVNYVMLGSVAGVVAIIQAIADYRGRDRGGRA